jgi:hypothetical protein
LVDYHKITGPQHVIDGDMNRHKAKQLYSGEIDKLHQVDVHDPDSWQTVSDDYFQWPNFVKLEPAGKI